VQLAGLGQTVTFCAKIRTKAATSPKPQLQALGALRDHAK